MAGLYDPTFPHDTPVYILTAVDLNGNGRRDYHEPVLVHNNMERFEDVGADGCGDADEDGLGGCGGGGEGEDPNGDNHRIPENALGTEGDGWRQEGEAWSDNGLDGVPGTDDFGEGDGEFTINPNLLNAMELTPWRWIEDASVEELAAVDVLMDGGTLIPRSQMEEECFGGHFYGNLQSDRWGDMEAATVMRYENMIFDLRDYMEANFRLLDPVEVDVR